MKRLFTLIVLSSMLFSCDDSSAPSNPTNPVQPAPVVAVKFSDVKTLID